VREGKLLDKSSTLSSYGTDVNVIKFAKIFTDSRGVQVTSLLSCFGGPGLNICSKAGHTVVCCSFLLSRQATSGIVL
jgi:hypothetical protein